MCICSNGDHNLLKAAACVKDVSPDDMESSYYGLKTLCDITGTPIVVSLEEWKAVGGTDSAETSSGASDDSATESASSPKKTDSGHAVGGLSKSEQITIKPWGPGQRLLLIPFLVVGFACFT
jgi:hypothetical protein